MKNAADAAGRRQAFKATAAGCTVCYAARQYHSACYAAGKIAAYGIEVKITEGHNYDLFSVADLALATSGTVTLEAALCGLPSVIVYRTSALNAFIARLVINIPNIGLPNIVAGKTIMPELLQEDFTPEKLAKTAVELLQPERQAQLQSDLAYMKHRLGEPGAVNRVAQLILKITEERK